MPARCSNRGHGRAAGRRHRLAPCGQQGRHVKLLHCAFVVATRREQLLLAFQDDGEVGGQRLRHARRRVLHGDAEYEANPRFRLRPWAWGPARVTRIPLRSGRMPPSQLICALVQLMSASIAPRTRACNAPSPAARQEFAAAGATSRLPPPVKLRARCTRSIRRRTSNQVRTSHDIEYRLHYPAMQLIEVSPVIPAALTRLPELAANLSYSWHRPTRALFEDLDQALWRQTHSSPRLMLRCVSQAALDQAAEDPTYLRRYDRGAGRIRPLPVAGGGTVRATADRLFLRRVRHPREPADLFRRPGHPGRRSLQGGQRRTAELHRRGPAVSAGLLHAVGGQRWRAARRLPRRRSARPAGGTGVQ